MKYLLFIPVLFFSFSLFSSHKTENQKPVSFFNSSAFDSVEVFVSITTNNTAVYNDVRAVLVNLQGVKYLAYCTNHAVFMIYIDRNIYPANNDFKNQLIKSLPQYARLIDLKNGAFKDLKYNCTANETDSEAIKTKFGG